MPAEEPQKDPRYEKHTCGYTRFTAEQYLNLASVRRDKKEVARLKADPNFTAGGREILWDPSSLSGSYSFEDVWGK